MAEIVNLHQGQRIVSHCFEDRVTYSKSTALSLVAVRILLIAPHATPVEPVDGLRSLFSTTDISTASIGDSAARIIVVVATVVL